MKQLWRPLTDDLCFQAICDFMQNGKFRRSDVLSYIEEWTGYSRYEVIGNDIFNKAHAFKLRYEIMSELALVLREMLDDICNGIDPEFEPVLLTKRPDGNTGKIRDIAYLCVRMQLLGHALRLGLAPLFQARFLPFQNASIPGRGPANLARQIKRKLNKQFGIKYFVKTDCTSAYKSTAYARILAILYREIPRAAWILKCMQLMEKYAPGGHLIIGGYLDAFLFNFVMSYAMRYVFEQYMIRRGEMIPMIVSMYTYMDDTVMLGSSRKALEAAVRRCGQWLQESHGIRLRQTTGIIRLYTIEEERAHRSGKTPAARGVPRIDIAGFRVCRTHIILRRRNNMRCIHCLTRAWKRYLETGSIKHQQANSIISRNGMMRVADCFKMKEKYHLKRLLTVAKRISSFWSKAENRRRERGMQRVLDRYRKYCKTGFGIDVRVA